MVNVRHVFYRILGNDLPPRHRKGQTLFNLKFILEYEPAFEEVEKRWIINKIIDPEDEKKIRGLLDEYRQKYRVISFDSGKFNKIPKECFKQRLEAMIGLNSIRNLALREGKQLAQWVLIFDGNCFFTDQGWKDVADACAQPGNAKYIVVPMMRMAGADQSFPCEPQIIFRYDSIEGFDEDFGYGQDSKVELLFRIGVKGMWDQWENKIMELSIKERSKEYGSFMMAGHVWRLPSGNRRAEMNAFRREECRSRGISSLMNKIDQGYHTGIV